jgi:hypothetical protein
MSSVCRFGGIFSRSGPHRRKEAHDFGGFCSCKRNLFCRAALDVTALSEQVGDLPVIFLASFFRLYARRDREALTCSANLAAIDGRPLTHRRRMRSVALPINLESSSDA